MQSLAAGQAVDPEVLGELRASAPLVAEVVAIDAAARRAEVGSAQIRDLEVRVAAEAPEQPLLRWWVIAVLGERALFDVDLGAIPLAIQVLGEVPAEPFAPTPIMYVRGRLRRLAAALYLVDPSPENLTRHSELREGAVADFLRCDFTAEAAITRALSAALRAIITWDDVLENLVILQEVRSTLRDLEESVWVPLLDQLAVLAAMTAGDLDAAAAAIDALDEHRGHHRVFDAFAAFGRALVQLAASEASTEAVDTMTGALDWLRRTHPQFLAQTQIQAANVCADFGSGAALTFGLAGLDWAPASAALAVRGRLLALRLDLLGGRDRPLNDAFELLTELEAMGHVRQAGASAVRVARDFDRASQAESAHALRAWGMARLPEPSRRTTWERRWADPGGPTGERRARTTTADGSGGIRRRSTDPVVVSVRVLAPTLEVEAAGGSIALRDMAAKLLLTLLLAHPSPVHVERASDVLWPDAGVDAGRRRLNTVVYRLRQALALDVQALRRSGDVLVLDPANWEIDLPVFRSALRDGGERAVAALKAVRGNLCHAQFPYDELFVEERRALAAEAARALQQIERAAGRPAEGLGEVLRVMDPDGSLTST